MKVELKKAALQRAIKTYQSRTLSNVGKRKLRSMEKMLMKIEQWQNKATQLGVCVSEFTGVSVDSISLAKSSQRNKDIRTSLGMYCKFGLENKIPVRFLLWYIGKNCHHVVYDARKSFNKSLKENDSIWKNFKVFATGAK